MKANREIVLSEEEIQNICNDFGKKLSKELENEEKTPLFLGVMKGALNFMFDLIKRIDSVVVEERDRPVFGGLAENRLQQVVVVLFRFEGA